MPGPMLSRLAVLGFAAAGLGCADLDRYTTAPSQSYCGSVTLSGAFRAALSPRMQMRLQLNAPALDGDISPGVLWTFEAGDGERPERRFLDRAPLRRIPKLENDALSMPDLGEGRD